MYMKAHAAIGVGGALIVALFIAVFATSPSDSLPEEAPVNLLPLGELSTVHPSAQNASTLPDQLGISFKGTPFLYTLFPRLLPNSPSPSIRIPTTPLPAYSAAIGAAFGGATSTESTKATSTTQALTDYTLGLRDSIVNIVCVSRDGSAQSISGTGVIIDPRGIILTVAHVAQLYLLEDYPYGGAVRCVVRTGSPAKTAYLAEPIYISPSWIKENSDTLVAEVPTGTGEHDFALLLITESATGSALPETFSYVPLSHGTPSLRDRIGIGSYGAQYLSGEQLRSSLYPIIVFGSVNNRYTFERASVDVVSVSGGAAAQEGSSGGAIINTRGELIGLITTSNISGDFALRNTRGITPLHIRRSFEEDTGEDFDIFVKSDIENLKTLFVDTSITLRDILVDVLSEA
jgi:hypothetical protein